MVRLTLVLLAGLLALAVAAEPGRAAPIKTPLATKGAKIVDAHGRTVVLQGVNWFGFETSSHVVHGLWTRDYDDVLAQVRKLGFNTIRLPFSLAALRSDTVTGVDFSGGKNAALKGKTPLEAMDVIIAAAARHGLFVVLDCHSTVDDGYQDGLWYGQGGFTETDWVRAWQRLARRYARTPNVVGADLKNEPHGPATWGTGGATDWRRAAERAGNAVLAAAPHWLILVEGIEGRVAGQRLDTHWWGGNLEAVRRQPVRLSKPNRLVYSPHEYGPGVFPQPWFSRPDMAKALAERWRTGFGYIAERGIAPILVGEFGGRRVDASSVEGRWQRQFLDHIARTGASWTYWALNPNSGDTGGILANDWTSIDKAKVALLQRVIRRQGIGYAAPRAGAPVRPPADPQPAPQPRPSAPEGLAAKVVVENRWADGWCGHLEVTGPAGATPRGVTLRVPAGTRIAQSWNAELSGDTGTIAVRFPDWARVPYTATGMCAAGSGTPAVSIG